MKWTDGPHRPLASFITVQAVLTDQCSLSVMHDDYSFEYPNLNSLVMLSLFEVDDVLV